MKVLALLPLLLASCGRHEAAPDLAVYTGQGFQLVNVESKSTRSIPCSIPVGSFSIAPNGRFLVFASKESRGGMGHIYQLDFESQLIFKLTSEPFDFTAQRFPSDQGEFPRPPERELYSDAEVSPDSRSVAFAVHSVADNDSDDSVGLSGPLAVIDLPSRRPRILSSTEKVDGQGPAFAYHPRWSSDGQKLLMAFEVSGAITSVSGDTLQWFDRQMPKPFDEGQVSPKGWWSNKEILYVWDMKRSGIGKLFRLDLTTGQVGNAASFLPVPEAMFNDVLDVDINNRYILIQHDGRTELFRRSGELLQTWSAGARLRLFN
jgi:WD40-like Beta Propeller Repeat